MKWDMMIWYNMTWPRLIFLAVTLFRWVKYYFLCCLSLSNLSSSQSCFFFVCFLACDGVLAVWQLDLCMRDSVVIFVLCGCSGECVWCLNTLGALRFDVWTNFIFWIYLNKMLLPPYFSCFLLLLVLDSSCLREGWNWFVGLCFCRTLWFVADVWEVGKCTFSISREW